MTAAGKESAPKAQSLFKDALNLIICAGGIYACYIGYGYLQEKMYLDTYGEKKEVFRFSLFLVFAQCIVNAAAAAVGWAIYDIVLKKSSNSGVPATTYMKISFAYIGAMLTSNLALTYVNYPLQVLAKSCKMIPVMISRIFINGKKYSFQEYFTVALITAGITAYSFLESGKASKVPKDMVMGCILLAVSLVLDAYTGPTQESLNETYKPSIHEMMFFMNVYAVLLTFVALFVTGEFWPALDFCLRFPAIMWSMVVFGILSAMGQYFILLTLNTFNSMVLATVTTTRKFFTILGSVVINGHHLSQSQWYAVGLVFFGLTLEILNKYNRPKHGAAKKEH